MPRLSVIVPAYNAAATLGAALRSTLRALPGDAEVVILDDGSTDSTAAAAGAIDDRRVRVISRPNAGVATTLNDLLAATDSEYVARMDADDLVLPGRFSRQLRAVQEGADVVFTTVVTWGSGGIGLPRPQGIDTESFPLHLLLTNPVAHSTMLARRASISAVGGYRVLPTEDYDLWLRLASSGARLTRLATPGLAYRVHPGQVTASADWRLSSWSNRDLAEAFSSLAERVIGAPATRFTSLSIDDSITAEEKRTRVADFSERLVRAMAPLPAGSRRALRRKLHERIAWLDAQLTPAGGVRT